MSGSGCCRSVARSARQPTRAASVTAEPDDVGAYCEAVSEASALADDYWSYYRETAQLWNIDRGDVDEIERWEDLTGSGVAERVRRLRDYGERAERSTRIDSNDEDVALMAAVAFSAASTASLLPWMRNRGFVSGPFNFATFLSVLVPGYRLVTRRHGDGYISKLDGIASFVDGWVNGLRVGLHEGQTATRRGVAKAITEYDRLLGTDVSRDPLAMLDPPTELTNAEAAAWREEVIAAIRGSVRPAVARLRDVLQIELLPGASSDDEPGLCYLPDGGEAYEELLWAATSTSHGSDAVHELGLAQLARLDDEYRQVGGPLLGVDDPTLMRDGLRTDPSLKYSSTGEIIHDVHSTTRSGPVGGTSVVQPPPARRVRYRRRPRRCNGVLHCAVARRWPQRHVLLQRRRSEPVDTLRTGPDHVS